MQQYEYIIISYWYSTGSYKFMSVFKIKIFIECDNSGFQIKAYIIHFVLFPQ